MLNLKNTIPYKKSKELTHSLNVHKYKNEKIHVVVSCFNDLDPDNIQSFTKEHGRILKSKHEKGTQIILGYDFSNLNNIDMTFVDTVVKQFQEYEKEYRSNVRCVFVFVKNELVINILNVVINMYELTVPLILTCSEKDVRECIEKYGC